jgi:N-acyl-D-aspartate/D-glutamate deacylase
MTHSALIQNGTIYDGDGGEGIRADVRIEDGVVVEIAAGLEPMAGERVIDAHGCWITPGFVDIHTHYDAEVELAPALSESLRHGVTTCVMGSCSLGMAVGKPDDLADMFCRVEAIPREHVLPALRRVKTWDTPTEYLEHLDGLPLGPNVACLLGHSGLRAHVMGLGDALSKRTTPSAAEMAEMDRLLEEALDVGYLGLSISTLPWDKMDGDVDGPAEIFRSRPMPSVFARWSEYRHLAKQLRERGKVLQAVPNISTKINVPLLFAMSAGVIRKGLKTTIISMMDIKADRFAFRIAGGLARVINRFLGGNLKMQALPNVFDLWADGIDLVVFEELEAGTAALHLKGADRDKLLQDPAFRARFKKQWRNKLLPRAFHRNLADTEILECPADPSIVGKSFKEVAADRGTDTVDAFLDLVVEHGDDLRWYTVMGNDRPEWVEYIMKHPDILVGFSDAGAHLRQMAHYNFPLRLLNLAKKAQDEGRDFMSVGQAVHRLTAEIADWLDVDAGHIAVGKRADIVVVDPAHLEAVEDIHYAPMPEFDLDRLVRRNDDAVRAVLVNGRVAVQGADFDADLGKERAFGRVLRAGQTHVGVREEKVEAARAA